jgi:hypothetical protein
MNTSGEVINATNLVIILFGFSTMVWMSEISQYFAVKYPRFIIVGIFPVFVSTISTIMYIILTYAKLLPAGFSTFLFAVDNALGMIFVASLDLICAFYLLFPFLKLGRDFLPKQVAKEISIFKNPPLKGSGATYIFVSFLAIMTAGILILPSLNQFLFGTCNEPFAVLCTRFSVFTVKSANYLSVNISLNEVIAQILVVTGALAAVLGVVQSIIEIYKAIKGDKKEKEVKEQTPKGDLPKSKKKA